MAFVPPMVSASPPPMSPDNTLEDVSVATDDMVEDEDDLTGLSEKLHSFPIDAIRAPPPPSPRKDFCVPEMSEENGENPEPPGPPARSESPESPEPLELPEVSGGIVENAPLESCDPEELANDDFCDFETAFPEQPPARGNPDGWAAGEQLKEHQDDDDFGDFGEVVTVCPEDCDSADLIIDFIGKIEDDTKTVISRLFDQHFDESVDSPKPYSLELARKEDEEIWPKISDVGATPSLTFVWKQSQCVDKLYRLLNIDKSIATTTENSQKLHKVPAFAAGLTQSGMLEPMPIASTTTAAPAAKASPDMPLNEILDEISNTIEPEPRVDHQILSDLSEKKKPELSQEAKAVVDAFPLLDFMRSPVLMFPIKAGDGGDPKM